MELLEIKNLKKQFGENVVLKDISMKVSEGEVVSILGPSGSGKSTLLRCATFLEQINDGEMLYCGECATKKDALGKPIPISPKDKNRLQQTFGLVFQNFNLFPHYSVMKNITDAPLTVQKRDKDEVFKEARELLKWVGLEDKGNAYPCELSGGQQQRVAIIRALMMNPKMLFFDEPTSALDPEITAGILHILRSLADKKMTMIIVTHEIAFARAISDRVIFMDDGKIVEEGTPQEVIDNSKNERTKNFLQQFQK